MKKLIQFLKQIPLGIRLVFFKRKTISRILANKAQDQKEAFIVLPGFVYSKKGMKAICSALGKSEYDYFIPDYVDRSSIAGSVKKWDAFVSETGIAQYKKVHVLCFQLGGWVFNSSELKLKNLATVIYDRSPVEKHVPKLMMNEMPKIAQMVFGKITAELAGGSMPVAEFPDAKIGLLIETRAIAYLRDRKEKAKLLGPINWDPAQFNLKQNDFMFMPYDHEEMYVCFPDYFSELKYFSSEGKFSLAATRTVNSGKDVFC